MFLVHVSYLIITDHLAVIVKFKSFEPARIVSGLSAQETWHTPSSDSGVSPSRSMPWDWLGSINLVFDPIGMSHHSEA